MLIDPISLFLVAFASATNVIAVNGDSLASERFSHRTLINLTGIAAHSLSIKDSCGKGQVINTTTLQTADGHRMKVTIEACESTTSTNTTRDVFPLEKRQMPSICNQSCKWEFLNSQEIYVCVSGVQSSHFNDTPAPDCTSLISTINSLSGKSDPAHLTQLA